MTSPDDDELTVEDAFDRMWIDQFERDLEWAWMHDDD